MSAPDKTPGYMRLSVIQSCAVDDVMITDALLRVLVALGSYASEQNSDLLWAGQDKIAKRMGVSRQSVGQRTRALEQLGYVEIDPRYRDDGGRASNWVRLRMDFQLPEERRRTGRLKAGVGGRPGIALVTPGDTSPETSGVSGGYETPRSFRGVKLPEVSGVKLPEVSGPETSMEFQQNLEKETGKETGKKKARARASSSSSKKSKRDAETGEAPAVAPISPPPPTPPAREASDGIDPVRLWRRVKDHIRGRQIGAAAIGNWIDPVRLVAVEDNGAILFVTLACPGSEHARILEQRYHGLLIGAFGALTYRTGSHVEIDYSTQNVIPSPAPAEALEARA